MTLADVADWASVIGLPLSVVGFLIALAQIRRTAKVAAAARDASSETRSAVRSNLEIADIAITIGKIRELEALLWARRLESATLRLADLRAAIIQIRYTAPRDSADDERFQRCIATIMSIEEDIVSLQVGNGDPNAQPNLIPDAHRALGIASDLLTEKATLLRLRTGGVDVNP